MQDIKFFYEGKNFIVVGASSGIGKQIALELSQAGANVLCLARRVEVMEQMKENQGSGKIIPAFVDVTVAKSADWDALVKNFVKEYGKISGGVYTAGISGLTAFRSWNEDLAKKIMDTSYWGMLRFLQAATKKRFSVDGASYVVFSSSSAYAGDQGVMVYASAKTAVQTAVKSIAREIGQNSQRINSVSPGWIDDTGMTSPKLNEYADSVKSSIKYLLPGSATAEKVSGVVLFLLSSRADWITGTDIVVDGGQLLGAM